MKVTRVAVVITRAPVGGIQENPEPVAHWKNVAKQKQVEVFNLLFQTQDIDHLCQRL